MDRFDAQIIHFYDPKLSSEQQDEQKRIFYKAAQIDVEDSESRGEKPKGWFRANRVDFFKSMSESEKQFGGMFEAELTLSGYGSRR